MAFYMPPFLQDGGGIRSYLSVCNWMMEESHELSCVLSLVIQISGLGRHNSIECRAFTGCLEVKTSSSTQGKTFQSDSPVQRRIEGDYRPCPFGP